MLQHVVLIPDGNRRWARKRGKLPTAGHREGAKTASDILDKALELEIPYITLWGASVSNVTKRSRLEVAFLYRIFTEYFKKLAKERRLYDSQVRVRVLGRWREFFPAATKRALDNLVTATRAHDRLNLTFLLAYSGIDEMTAAAADIARAARRDRNLRVRPETVDAHLWSRDLPPVDLVIRTGGEPHWSEGLLMWKVANAQLHFTPTLWPDFTPEEFERIVRRHERTERRFGA